MRGLVYYVAVSIDGFIADRHGGFDAFLTEGDHMSVLFSEFADALPAHAHQALGITPPRTHFDTVIMGWNTLTPALDAGVTSPYPHLQQVIASRHSRHVDAAIRVTNDPLTTVRQLKRAVGLDIWLCGGGQLAGTLLPEIDRIIVKRNPLVFGNGIPMFGNTADHVCQLRLTHTRTFDSGVTIEEYAAQH